jgi:hypothetical protein
VDPVGFQLPLGGLRIMADASLGEGRPGQIVGGPVVGEGGLRVSGLFQQSGPGEPDVDAVRGGQIVARRSLYDLERCDGLLGFAWTSGNTIADMIREA